MPLFSRSLCSLSAMMLALWCSASHAAMSEALGAGVSKKQPVMLSAREVGYDEPHAVATAIGNVEVVQGETILLADRIEYNQNTDVMHATGHVSILEPTGDVLFSDDAWLTQSMEKGVVQQFRARLKDNSLFAAREAHKVNKNVTRLDDAVYSPCKVCQPAPGSPAKAPLWQMQAHTVTVDENAQRVYYRDAFMELYGLPVIYTPYFSHPTPDAPSQSGFLTPQYFHATDLGNVVKEPLFISLAPNTDMTLTPWYLSQEKPLLEGEFRHLFDGGFYTLRGAITDTYDRDAEGNIAPGNQARGYIEAHGRAALSEHWSAGLDAERTTDDTFLQLYRFGWQDILTSRLYAERIEDRDYAVIESLAFQGLEPQDIANQSPYILPQASVHYETDPGLYHSRAILDASALVLERSEGDNDQRLSGTMGWKIPYITRGGQVFEAKAQLRADGYNVDSAPTVGINQTTLDGEAGRLLPEVDLNWRYPLVNRFGEGRSLTIAPVVELAASPDMRNNNRVPDEDSQIAELNDVNLFSPDRFTGLDQVESGFRGTYGMRGQLQFADQKFVEWLLGQAYQNNTSSPFPLATDPTARFSDYVGRLAFKYKWLDVAYSFRLDRDSLSPTSNEVTTTFALSPVSLDLTYVSLENEPLFGNRREIFGSAGLDVTHEWRWNVSGRRDLGSEELSPLNPLLPVSPINPLEASAGTVGLNTGLTFHNECMMLTFGVGRNYISQQDVKPSTTFSVVLTLKNLGDSGQTGLNPLFAGAGNMQTSSLSTDTLTPNATPIPSSATEPFGSTH